MQVQVHVLWRAARSTQGFRFGHGLTALQLLFAPTQTGHRGLQQIRDPTQDCTESEQSEVLLCVRSRNCRERRRNALRGAPQPYIPTLFDDPAGDRDDQQE